jgi:SAM-dependent methyltransferase
MQKRTFEVNVDNTEYAPALDPISSHSRIADFYKHRPPYLKDFFQEASIKLGLTKEDDLLDLCCGRGEISSGFSQYVNSIKAVDGSSEMLRNAIDLENVNYHLADVNVDEMPFIKNIDHVVIGSAIHWITGEKISEIAKNNLNSQGKFFVSHTLFRFDDQPYVRNLIDLNKKYGRLYSEVDLWGEDKFQTCGFIPVDRIRLVRKVLFDIEFLYWNQLSYAYRDFYKNIFDNGDSYKNELVRVISPFSKNGQISATLVNWAVIYRSANS